MLSSLSNIADKVNGPMLLITAVSLVLLAAITGTMIYFVFRYSRRRNRVADEIHGHAALEIAWTVIPTIIAFGFFWYGWVGYKFIKNVPDDAMVVDVTGRMWSWQHEYDNGVTSEELNVPVDRPVKLELHSTDVIHSYFIPAFKVKQDVVPGVDGLYLWFTAKQVGTYDVFCAEYCGLNHSAMLTKVNVMGGEEFDTWYESEGAEVAAARELLESEGEVDAGQLQIVGAQLATSKGCVACHSVDGSALIGPSFKGLFGKTETVVTNGQERQIIVDDAYLRASILSPNADIVKGFQPLMPSQQGLVSDNELDAIITYIKSIE